MLSKAQRYREDGGGREFTEVISTEEKLNCDRTTWYPFPWTTIHLRHGLMDRLLDVAVRVQANRSIELLPDHLVMIVNQSWSVIGSKRGELINLASQLFKNDLRYGSGKVLQS